MKAPPTAIFAQKLIPLLLEMKKVYLVWYQYYQILPKIHRHSLGIKIDKLFVEIIETIAIASYLSREEKTPWIRLAIRKVDTLRIMLLVLWESKSIEDKKFITLSVEIERVGKMLGGWQGQVQTQLQKQNSPAKAGEK